MTRIIRRETRERTGWGRLWRWALAGWAMFAAYDIIRIQTVIDGVCSKQSDGWGKLGATIGGNAAMNEALMIYGSVGAALLVLVMLMPGRKVIIEETLPDRVGKANS